MAFDRFSFWGVICFLGLVLVAVVGCFSSLLFFWRGDCSRFFEVWGGVLHPSAVHIALLVALQAAHHIGGTAFGEFFHHFLHHFVLF